MISINGSVSKDKMTVWNSSQQMKTIGETGRIAVERYHKRVKILFSNVNAMLSWNDGDHVEWDCSVYPAESEVAKSIRGDVVLSLHSANTCRVTIPKNLALYVTSSHGTITLDKPTNDYEIDLTNGVVIVTPDPFESFSYDLRTTHGPIDVFDRPESIDSGKSSKIVIVNGIIKRN